MAKRLLIVGAGGFGREVLAWASDVPTEQRAWSVISFLDSNASALNDYDVGACIIGDPATYTPQPEDVFVPALGDPSAKLRVCRDLRNRGAKFINLIHPSAIIGERCQMGEGCVLCPGAILTADVTLGDFVMLNVASNAGHDAVIGDGCTLSGHVDVTGFVRLGEGVFLGTHAAVLPGVHVGNCATIGAGSIVIRKVRPGATVFGVPARVIDEGGHEQEVRR